MSTRPWFIEIAARERLTTLLPTIALRADVYLGVAPRHATTGSCEGITHAHVAWADVALLEQLNQRLAAALAGDSVWAATTILRPPGTLNHKHDPPRPVHIIVERPGGYDPDCLLSRSQRSLLLW